MSDSTPTVGGITNGMATIQIGSVALNMTK